MTWLLTSLPNSQVKGRLIDTFFISPHPTGSSMCVWLSKSQVQEDWSMVKIWPTLPPYLAYKFSFYPIMISSLLFLVTHPSKNFFVTAFFYGKPMEINPDEICCLKSSFMDYIFSQKSKGWVLLHQDLCISYVWMTSNSGDCYCSTNFNNRMIKYP